MAGSRTTEIYAEILVGGFAVKLAIILEQERLGPEEHIVFLGKVDTVLRVSIQVGIRF